MGVATNGRRPWDIAVHDERFYRQVLMHGTLGLGESYVNGLWNCEDLQAFFVRVISGRQEGKVPRWLGLASRMAGSLAGALNRQTRTRATRVVEVHYDLNPHLFEAMLGQTMAYTCAYWPSAETIDDAQRDKFDLICRKLRLKPGDRVLDIGCGFGSFARFAAGEYGCEVVGVTLSPAQAEYARRFCANLPVRVHVCDYRDLHVYLGEGRFDSVVSVGMFEAVGRRNFRTYMEVVHRALKDRGLWLLHTIGADEWAVEPWLARHIFPNGELPELGQIDGAVRGLFNIEDLHNFGTDYARTLAVWDERFRAHWSDIRRLDVSVFTDRFFRTWTYYLACCAASFRSRNIQLWQVVMSKGCLSEGYRSVR